MSIRTKMISTLGVVILLLAAITLAIDHQVNRFGELKDTQIALTQVMAQIGDMRKQEKDFLHRKEAGYVQRFDTTYKDTDANISRLIETLTAHSLDATEISDVQREIREYREKFDSIAELQREIGLDAESGLYGRLREAVHAAEAVFDDSSDHKLLSGMLMLRRAEKDFMLRRNMKYVGKYQQQFDQLQGALSRTDISAAELSQAQQLMERYRADFLTLVEAERRIGLGHEEGLLGELRQTVHVMEARLDRLFGTLDQSIRKAHGQLQWTLFATVLVVSLSIAGLLLLIGYSILRRIQQATRNMQQIAAGDGDLSRRLEEQGTDEISELAKSFNLFAVKIHDTLKGSAELINSLGQIGDRVTDAASSTDCSMKQLRSNTHSVVTATEEMSTTARDVASNASHVSTSTQQANRLASEGRKVVEQSVQSIDSFADEFSEAATTISSLRAETENIGGILDVIRGIAEQTNLLALNAAIEAARAGEQGRGFAVVADEVRNLAHRSQVSTNEIQELIERLQSQAESASAKIQHGHQRISDTVAKARQAGSALSQITESVASISDMTTQIATAAEEQSMVVSEINQNVVTIDQLAKGTAVNADLTTHLTGELAHAMSQVLQMIRQFRFANDEQLVLAQAKTAHTAWKARLRNFLDGKSHLSQDQALSHHQCDLGKWYDGEGKQRFGHLAEFKAIERPHEQIHALIKQVIDLQEKGDQQGAESVFNDVSQISEQIVRQLDALSQAVK